MNITAALLLHVQSQVPSLVESIKESGLLLGLFGGSSKALPHVDIIAATEGVLTAKTANP